VFAWRAFPARGDASPGAYLAVPALESAGIRIAFTTRHGGFSGDPFSSLNLSFFSGDDPDVVMANRARAMAVIGGDPASWTSGRQVHGAEFDGRTGRFVDGADRLLHGALGIEERDVGDRVEPPGVGAAELRQPAVVGARVGRGQRAVGDVPFPADPDRRIEEDGVDALRVHDA